MLTGTVKWFNSAKGYGFITPDNGSDDCFVHVTAVQASGYKQLLENQRVEFEMQEGRNGRMVDCNLTMLDDAAGEAAELFSNTLAKNAVIRMFMAGVLGDDRNLHNTDLSVLPLSKRPGACQIGFI